MGCLCVLGVHLRTPEAPCTVWQCLAHLTHNLRIHRPVSCGHTQESAAPHRPLDSKAHLRPGEPLVPEVIIFTQPKLLAPAPTVVSQHLGIGFEDVVDGVQAVHMADLFPILQGSPLRVEQVPVGIHD